MDSLAVPRKLWEHPNPESTEMYRFMQEINKKNNLQLQVYMVPLGDNATLF
jgi:acetoacetyl-CoA synthetase